MRKKLFKQLLCEEKGQTLVLVAVALTVLLGITAFTTDVGYLQWQKRHLQNTADAAALAAVRELIDGDIDNIEGEDGVVYTILEDHGVAGSEIDNIIIDNPSVTVELRGNRELFFARILGFGDADVAARAVAAVGIPSGMGGLRPVGFSESAYNDAKAPGGDGVVLLSFKEELGPGTWSYVFFPPDNHQDATVVDRMWNGCPHIVEKGQDINVKKGNVPHAEDPVESLIGDGTIVYVPILKDWDDEPGGGHYPIEVVGFAAVQFTHHEKQGANYILEGKFIKTLTATHVGIDFDADESEDFGLKSIALIE